MIPYRARCHTSATTSLGHWLSTVKPSPTPTINIIHPGEHSSQDVDVHTKAAQCSHRSDKCQRPKVAEPFRDEDAESESGLSEATCLERPCSPFAPAHESRSMAVSQCLSELDHEEFVVRDGSIVQNRILGLCITATSLPSLTSHMSEKQAAKFARTILASRKTSVRVALQLLQRLEMLWTGYIDSFDNDIDPAEVITLNVDVVTFFSSSWEIVREMTYLAVSDDALITLRALAGCADQSSLESEFRPENVAWTLIDSLCDRMKEITSEENILAAILRSGFTTKICENGSANSKSLLRLSKSVVLAPADTFRIRSLICQFYGVEAIDQCRLCREDRLHLRVASSNTRAPCAKASSPATWNTLKTFLRSSGDGTIFLSSTNPPCGSSTGPRRCLLFTTRAVDEHDMPCMPEILMTSAYESAGYRVQTHHFGEDFGGDGRIRQDIDYAVLKDIMLWCSSEWIDHLRQRVPVATGEDAAIALREERWYRRYDWNRVIEQRHGVYMRPVTI